MNKPSTELEIKGNDWQFCCRGELTMYVPLYTNDITIICGSDRADAQISIVKPQRFDAETSFIDACCNCNVRGAADDPEHYACCNCNVRGTADDPEHYAL